MAHSREGKFLTAAPPLLVTYVASAAPSAVVVHASLSISLSLPLSLSLFRDQARAVRSARLLELGAPPEYIPALRTNVSGTEGKAEAATAPEAEETGARKKGEGDGRPDNAIPIEYTAGSSPPDDASQGAVNSSDGAAAAVPPESPRAALSTPGVRPAGAAGAPALSEGFAAASAVHGEEGKARTGGGEEEAAGASVEPAVTTSAVNNEQEQEQEQGQGEEEEEQEEEKEEEKEEASAYARASQEFGRLGACSTPAEMLKVVKSGMTSLCDDAARISVSRFDF